MTSSKIILVWASLKKIGEPVFLNKEFNSYKSFFHFLKEHPNLYQFVRKYANKAKRLELGIIAANIKLETDAISETFLSISELEEYLSDNIKIAESLDFGEIKIKRSLAKLELGDFAERLKIAMELRGMSQSRLSILIGTSQPEISYYLSRRAYPRTYKLQKIAITLHVSYKWLKTGQKKMEVPSIYPMNDFWATINERVIFLFMINNVKPVDIQDRIGISNTEISMWLDDKRKPSRSHKKKIIDFFGICPEWLESGTGTLLME